MQYGPGPGGAIGSAPGITGRDVTAQCVYNHHPPAILRDLRHTMHRPINHRKANHNHHGMRLQLLTNISLTVLCCAN